MAGANIQSVRITSHCDSAVSAALPCRRALQRLLRLRTCYWGVLSWQALSHMLLVRAAPAWGGHGERLGEMIYLTPRSAYRLQGACGSPA